MAGEVNAQKAELADDILQNPVYRPESGLYERLKGRLTRLPLGELSDLKLLVGLKAAPADGEGLRRLLDLEAVRVTCINARDMLHGIREKVPKSPHGAGPNGWLANALGHLDLIISAAVEAQEAGAGT